MKERVFNYLSCVALAVPIALFSRCEAVVAMTDPPFEGVVGAFVAMLKGKAYLYNIRDMYPDMAVGRLPVWAGSPARAWEKKAPLAARGANCGGVGGADMKKRVSAKGRAAGEGGS